MISTRARSVMGALIVARISSNSFHVFWSIHSGRENSFGSLLDLPQCGQIIR